MVTSSAGHMGVATLGPPDTFILETRKAGFLTL